MPLIIQSCYDLLLNGSFTVQLEEYGAKNVRFIMNMVSSNENEHLRDFREYFSKLPEGKIIGKIKKVAAVKRLRESDIEPFKTPPSKVNNLSRTLYFKNIP
jgi:hypothetical protein